LLLVEVLRLGRPFDMIHGPEFTKGLTSEVEGKAGESKGRIEGLTSGLIVPKYLKESPRQPMLLDPPFPIGARSERYRKLNVEMKYE